MNTRDSVVSDLVGIYRQVQQAGHSDFRAFVAAVQTYRVINPEATVVTASNVVHRVINWADAR